MLISAVLMVLLELIHTHQIVVTVTDYSNLIISSEWVLSYVTVLVPQISPERTFLVNLAGG
jgi:hypothetical protein